MAWLDDLRQEKESNDQAKLEQERARAEKLAQEKSRAEHANSMREPFAGHHDRMVTTLLNEAGIVMLGNNGFWSGRKYQVKYVKNPSKAERDNELEWMPYKKWGSNTGGWGVFAISGNEYATLKSEAVPLRVEVEDTDFPNSRFHFRVCVNQGWISRGVSPQLRYNVFNQLSKGTGESELKALIKEAVRCYLKEAGAIH